MTVISTENRSQIRRRRSSFSGGNANTIRSWDSDNHISQGCSPWYLRGTLSSCTLTPVSSPISLTAEESPPAPQSVMAVYSLSSRATRMASSTIFSVIGLPICTAPPEVTPVSSVSSMEEKVAPWMPSRPVRPPSTTTRSPGRAPVGWEPTGAMPTHPQYTKGLAV